ncbi:EAL domain-containing protein [Oleiagrimonas sp. C23AA]|uniref:GGDEF/EAL domain-containing response regulator n=1 Tax=Oleiagrimonas sp. C23AA TaxID=2719047 RepID=UPI00141E5E96|nr:EAL domain-containing protein [Oleiagrimonas sp. C23AA]NII10209.1 EAL domain-containing protein [Oleiagrimonas sp. C23AA]
MKQDNVIRILFVEDSIEDAEQVISLLRNHGIAVRPSQATNEAQLEAILDEQAPDLALLNPDTRDLDAAAVVRHLDATGKDFALVALVDVINDDVLASMFALGIRAVATRGREQQVLLTVQREFEWLSTRRQVRKLEASLRECERRCDALLDSSRDPIAYVHEGMHVRANRAYLEMFGYESFDDVEGLTLLDMVASKDADTFKALLKRLARGEKPPQRVEVTAQRADGSQFDAVLEFSQASFEGEACLQIVFRRQLVDPAVAEQLQRDLVTGLYNRGHMLELIDQAVAKATEGVTSQALLLIEPDHWPQTVDAIGLANADALLNSLAQRIGDGLGEDDFAGRLGDHTLGVMLVGHSDEQVRTLVEHMQLHVTEHLFDAGEHSISLTLCIGGSLLGEKNANTQQLLEQASAALRSAQTQGANHHQLHDPAAREKEDAARERGWLAQVTQALADGSFVLYYQQVVSLQDAEGEFHEILLRMNGPNGEVPPSYFLPVAENHGLMPQIDRWVISRAIDMLRQRESEGQTCTLFVKVTAETMQDPSLLPWLTQRMGEAAIRPHALVLECPEAKVLTGLKSAQSFVATLKRLGIDFALEQFGSGLNSFQVLKHIDADYLKIDRNFMAALPQHADNQARIRSICQQARESGKLTVAEWVEDAASTSLLFACGVDFVQGNFLQEPEKVMALDVII